VRAAGRYPRWRSAAGRRADPRRDCAAAQLAGMALWPCLPVAASRHHRPGRASHPDLPGGVPVEPGRGSVL